MSLPPGYRALYDSAGPVIRYRLLRDVIGEDNSYIRTLHHGLDVQKLPEVQKIIFTQKPDGSWGDVTTTVWNFLRLCELGQESCHAIELCTENHVIPTLLTGQHLPTRDTALHLLLRARHEPDPILKTLLEQLLAEWELFLSGDPVHHSQHSQPTSDGYAALCFYPWNDDDLPRVQQVVKKLFTYAETKMDSPQLPVAFQLCSKNDYVLRPQRMIRDLELSARLGMTRELAATRWMFDELEAMQDGDGWFRLEHEPEEALSWYFPLDPDHESHIDFSFRAALIFKLLEYDF